MQLLCCNSSPPLQCCLKVDSLDQAFGRYAHGDYSDQQLLEQVRKNHEIFNSWTHLHTNAETPITKGSAATDRLAASGCGVMRSHFPFSVFVKKAICA